MKKRNRFVIKCLSGITSAALLLSGAPVATALAEEPYEESYDESFAEYSEDYYEEPSGDTSAEGAPAEESFEEDSQEVSLPRCLIKSFPEYKKTDDGRYEKDEMQEKYGNLTKNIGTEIDSLELPKSIKLDIYDENDETRTTFTVKLKDIKWKAADSENPYDISSPAGTYTFKPDLDDYLDPDDLTFEDVTIYNPDTDEPVALSHLALAEDVKLPKISISFVDPNTVSDVPTADDQTGEEPFFDETGSENIDINTQGTEDVIDPGFTFDESTQGAADNSVITKDAAAAGDDVFSGIDDSVLMIDDGTIEIYGDNTTPETEASIPEPDIQTNDDVLIIETAETSLQPEQAMQSAETTPDTQPSTEPAAPDAPADTQETTEEVLIVETASTELAPVVPSNDVIPVSGTVTIADASGTVSCTLKDTDGKTDKSVPLTPSDTDPTDIVEITLPCNMPATGLKLTVKANDVEYILADLSTAAYTEGAIATVSKDETSYKLKLKLNSTPHTMNPATCTTPQTCSVCDAAEGDPLGHNWVAATCTAPKTCSVCGATEGNPLGHTWVDATCTKPKTCSVCGATEGTTSDHKWTDATCTTPKTCSVCQTTVGEPLGHDWVDATCTEPQTCVRCETTKGDPLGHKWVDATCTKPKTCARCKATKGSALGHDMTNNWETISKSTYTTHGEQVRYCNREDCTYSETRYLNIIGNPYDNKILNLEEGATYALNGTLSFNAAGAGMANANPIEGDVRYYPVSWNIQGKDGSFLNNFGGAFAISKAGTYTVTVTFQRQTFTGGSWKNNTELDAKSVTFHVGQLVQGIPTDASGIRINPQTGDSTPIIPLVCAFAAALIALIGVVIYRKRRK